MRVRLDLEVWGYDVVRDIDLPFLPPSGMLIYEGEYPDSLEFVVLHKAEFRLKLDLLVVYLAPSEEDLSIDEETAAKLIATGKWREMDQQEIYKL